MFTFHVMGGKDVRAVIEKSRPDIFARVRDTYLAHHRGATINPNSYFLRFPEKPDARIIALPAALREDGGLAGLKWIGSYPANVRRNVPRASAVLLLNDFETGYPFAALEAAQISAARTAASAVLGAEAMHGSRTVGKAAVVGAGVISRAILDFFHALGWSFDEIQVHDTQERYAHNAAQYVRSLRLPRVRLREPGRGRGRRGDRRAGHDRGHAVHRGPGCAVRRAVRAQHLAARHRARPDRRFAQHRRRRRALPERKPSPHLAVQKFGHREFLDGTLAELLLGQTTLSAAKPRIFSPLGSGCSISRSGTIFQAGLADGRALEVPDFFAETQRW